MFDDLQGAKAAPSIAPKTNEPEPAPKKPQFREQNVIVPPLRSQVKEDQVDDMFAEVDKPAVKPAAGRARKKKASESAGGETAIKILIILVILLILGIFGFVIANRFLGLVVFEGLDFLNKPVQSSAVNEVPVVPTGEKNNQDTPKDSEIIPENPAVNNPETVSGVENNEIENNSETAIATATAENIQIEEPGTGDRDDDGLTDKEEATLGTDMNNRDTDGDGLFDGDEYLDYKTNAMSRDTDGDELPDGEEVLKFKTNPKNPDTDGDTYLDGLEVKNGYNPLAK